MSKNTKKEMLVICKIPSNFKEMKEKELNDFADEILDSFFDKKKGNKNGRRK